MSYETNPILNRIKIIKGWKNPTFPTKTLNYSRDMILWFKVYLFLKVYLWCQKIRLLTCEIRTTEGHHKILYLSISKHIPPKKNIKSKWKTKSFLQNLKSPLTKAKSKKARFLLYQDLQTLKKKSELFFNIHLRRKNSKAWFSKTRLSVWLNFAHLIYARRQWHIKQQNGFWKKKKKTVVNQKIWTESQRFLFKSKKRSGFSLAEKKKLFFNQTQKIFLHLLVKYRKNLFFLKKMLSLMSSQKANWPKKTFSSFFQKLTKKYNQVHLFLEQLQKIYQFWKKIQAQTPTEKSISFWKPFINKLFLKKTKGKVNLGWLYLKKESSLLQRRQVFFFSKTKQISSFKNVKKNNSVMGLFEHGNAFTQIQRNLWNHNFRSGMLLPKIRFFRKPTRFRSLKVFKFLRFAQKKKFYRIQKNTKKRIILKANKKKILFKKSQKGLNKKKSVASFSFLPKVNPERVKSLKKKKLSYRLSFRQHYKNHLTLKTNLKLKYLIQDLLQQYFSLVLCVKLFWPLAQFKNVKFYRLIFPAYKNYKLKKKNQPFTLNKNLRKQKKKYLYIGQNTNHLKLQSSLSQTEKKFLLYRKFLKRKKNLSSFTKGDQKQSLSVHLSSFWQKKLEKKNKYLSLKTKVIQAQSEKRLLSMSKQKFILNLITTLTLFVKYLEPQPLADHLAKIIGETKRHATILKIIKTVLRTLHFKRGLGYRIALSGRINGTNKSRTFYLKKLNRNRPRQTFSKNVNFAMAQARASIGAFGIKIWVYS